MLLLGLLAVSVAPTITMIVFSIGSHTEPNEKNRDQPSRAEEKKENSVVVGMQPIPIPLKKI